jgi:uncharacterized DUF497 family protein
MHELEFEWDDRKATQNKRKHGVSFEEARTVFLDAQALLMRIRITPATNSDSCCSVSAVHIAFSLCVTVTERRTRFESFRA